MKTQKDSLAEMLNCSGTLYKIKNDCIVVGVDDEFKWLTYSIWYFNDGGVLTRVVHYDESY